MKRIILFTFFFIFHEISWSQNLSFERQEIVGGINHLTQEPIPAVQYKFPYLIYSSYLPSQDHRVTLQFRLTDSKGEKYKSEGYLSVFDLENEKFIWSQKTKTFDVKQDSVIIIQIKPNKSYLVPNRSYGLNINTGEEIWESKTLVKLIERNQNIAIGFEYRNPGLGASKKLQGINVIDGTVKWDREISYEYGLNEVIHLNDSVLLMAANGLHTVNINTGMGWDYHVETGIKDYGTTAFKNAVSLSLFAATGISTPMAMGHEVITGIASNIYVHGSRIYFASYEELVCLDYDGNIIWKYPMNKELMSKSTLLIHNQTLYVVNRGIAVFRNKVIQCGEPFVEAYNLSTGEILFHKFIGDNRIVNSLQIKNDALLLAFNDRISTYSLQDGSHVAENLIDTQALGYIKYLLGSQVYVQQKDSTLASITLSDSSKSYVLTAYNKILSFDQTLEIGQDIIDYDSCFTEYLRFNNLKLLSHNLKTVVINEENKLVARLSVSGKSKIKESKLYDTQRENLLIIDLKNIADR